MAKKFKPGDKVFVTTTFGRELEKVLEGLAPKRVLTINRIVGESIKMEKLTYMNSELSFHVTHLRIEVIPIVNRFQLMDME